MFDAASTASTLADRVTRGSEDSPLQQLERELNTETQSAQGEEGWGDGESDWTEYPSRLPSELRASGVNKEIME
jgi:hypothetical protein